MADFSSQPSPTEKSRRPISSSLFMSSPRLFTSFTSKNFSETTESVMSPTSILDSKPFSSFNLKNPFFSDTKSASDQEITTPKHRPWDKGIGLGIVDALNDEKSDQKQPNSETRMVLFGSHLKIQIPPLQNSDSSDFGIKTRNSHLGFSPIEKSASGSASFGAESTPMELSEDYTCVITHGPNPKTTHIFDNCVVEESCFGVVGFSGARKEGGDDQIFYSAFRSENFLSFCCTCKKNLDQGNDIYMYRGEKAFCSHECRYDDMLMTDMEAEMSLASKTAPPKHKYHRSAVKCFGVDLTPDNIAVAMVYFVQGVLGLSRLAVSFYLKDDLHLDPAETAVITGFSALPWLIKPVYGFISDSVPLFGYRRRSYLILSGLLGALSWSLMASLVDGKYSVAFCILLGSLSVAFSDVVVDSMVVERARGESQSVSGSLQSLCWGSSAFGGIVSSYFSGSLVDAYGVRFVFGVTALLPLLTSAVAVLVTEQRVLGPARGQIPNLVGPSFLESSKQNIIQLWDAVRQPTVLLPTIFLFLWQATPQSDSAMFYFTTNKLAFTPEFLGRVKLITSVASLLGVGLYNGFLKNVPLKKIFLATTIIGSALGMTQVFLVTGLNRRLGISDEWFAIGDSLILTVLGQASFMPVLVLAAKLCPEGMEATLFATLMSISNGGSVLGGLIGAGLTQLFGVTKDTFDNLAFLIILCNLTSLLPLPLLGLLPDDGPDSNLEENADIEMKSN